MRIYLWLATANEISFLHLCLLSYSVHAFYLAEFWFDELDVPYNLKYLDNAFSVSMELRLPRKRLINLGATPLG